MVWFSVVMMLTFAIAAVGALIHNSWLFGTGTVLTFLSGYTYTELL
jgi:hypothetical protein